MERVAVGEEFERAHPREDPRNQLEGIRYIHVCMYVCMYVCNTSNACSVLYMYMYTHCDQVPF